VQRVSRYTQNLQRYGYVHIEKSGDGNRNTYTLLTGDEMNRPEQINLKEYAKEFLEYSLGVHSWKTYRTDRTAFREFVRVEGNKPLASIGVREIEHFLSVKKREASEWTARKYYGSLAAAFEKAILWEYLKINPFKKVKKPKPPETLPVFFSKEEFNTLISCFEDTDFRELCHTAIHTGQRLNELLSARWKDIDFTLKTIQIINTTTFTTKSRKNRIIPLDEEIFKMLKDRKENIRNESEFIFNDKRGRQLKESTVSQKFKRFVRRAQLNDKLHFHSLRHSFATHLVKKRVPLYAVQKLLGHADSKTTEVYSHLQPEQLHREVNVLAGMFKINI
jgi:integrase/recombinase XerD